MSEARVALQLPEGCWMRDVTQTHPGSVVHVLGSIAEGGTGYATVRVLADDLSSVLAEVEHHQVVEGLQLLRRMDSRATVYITTNFPIFHQLSSSAQVPFEWPIHISQGEATIRTEASEHLLGRLVGVMETSGYDYVLEYVGDNKRLYEGLSPRQREILVAAVKKGYYDSPRDITLTELADEFDIAKSTCSEILHRAEGTIMHQVVPVIDPADDVQPIDDPGELSRSQQGAPRVNE